MIIHIEHMPAYKTACIRSVGPYGSGNRHAMEYLKAWANANNLMNDKTIIFGIAQDNPETTPPENCRYDTCIVIADDDTADSSMSVGHIAGGKYAVFEIEHTAEAVTQAWAQLFPELQRLRYEMDAARPIMERYTAKMVSNHRCEICVPII